MIQLCALPSQLARRSARATAVLRAVLDDLPAIWLRHSK